MTHGIYEFALTLPITQGARRTAVEFATQQPTPAKADQVRLNTLAVLVVQDYFQLMEIPTDLHTSDSWDPVMRVCLDVADLEVPGVGRLECRPVLPDCDRCLVPAETWEDRVGYVVVQVDEAASEAQILGFVPVAVDEELALSELRSPEDLLDHLFELRQVETVPQLPPFSERLGVTGERVVTNLGNWLQTVLQEGQQAIEEGWMAVEQVLLPSDLSPAYAFRRRSDAVRRAKRLHLGTVSVALVVEVRTETDLQAEIRLQLHPVEATTQLPARLQMAVLDAEGAIVIEAEATGREDFLELQIDGAAGEEFRVRVQFNSAEHIESFVI
ncbi:MAG: DUF1822 family protein [Leptolyngbyaceae cyanobacterium bins.349]|nr:DUF1822 family protein [Leptolyngbyaceae cyanobacterium bins.349]